ncbi:MAG: hypothetical protein KC518_10905 [Candidatus Cloacimonetes bacterium]|nr:hypothetical protein [Candidatus Cloacimonadota bacterium]
MTERSVIAATLRILGLAMLLLPGWARAQCMLANPSFEIPGADPEVFAGWNQFGVVLASDRSSHGALALEVRGPDSGNWDVSGAWQRLDSQPGEQWQTSGTVRQSALMPLTGPCAALVNIEWRDAAEGLIAYDTFSVAVAGSPVEQELEFSVLSTAAPAGTTSIRLLLGVLQGPSEPSPAVTFDRISCSSTSAPTVDDVQWLDFPGGRTLSFADHSWRVKGPGWYGPGPNNFSDSAESVWVDAQDRLHLTIRHRDAAWQSTEVVLEDALGYGDYIFTTQGAVDLLDPTAVLGLFLWQYGECYEGSSLWWNAYNEIDVELSRWGNPANDLIQYVVQPWDWAGNIHRFDASFGNEELASHAFRWLPDRVEFRSWRGGPDDESGATLYQSWTYSGPHIPRPEQPRVHLNLWQASGPPAAEQEVILADFRFVSLTAPGAAIEDLAISLLGSSILLTWSAIPQASAYHILESASLDGPWTRIGSTAIPGLSVPLAGPRKFYRATWE